MKIGDLVKCKYHAQPKEMGIVIRQAGGYSGTISFLIYFPASSTTLWGTAGVWEVIREGR